MSELMALCICVCARVCVRECEVNVGNAYEMIIAEMVVIQDE